MRYLVAKEAERCRRDQLETPVAISFHYKKRLIPPSHEFLREHATYSRPILVSTLSIMIFHSEHITFFFFFFYE